MTGTPSATTSGNSCLPRLSIMMFLQYAIWGAWLPILYPFLLGHRGFSLEEVGWIFAAGAVGAIIGPFIAGQIADRWFATEKFLAVSHAAGAVLVWMLAGVSDYTTFLGLSLVYGLVYAPTLSLTNSLAFHHLADRNRDFGRVRLWGTVGWIAVGICMGHWLAMKHTPENATVEAVRLAQDAGRADAFRLSAILGSVMAVFCLFLPHTPPSKAASRPNASFAALSAVRRQPLITLFLLAVPISCIHQFYFVHTAGFLSEVQRTSEKASSLNAAINDILGVGGGGLMTIGQMAEIAVLALMPALAKRRSRKALLAMGIVAYALRMAIFADTTKMPLIMVGLALHGFCFGCFIFVAFMVVDEETPSDLRASAQSLFNLVIIGVGIIVGSLIANNWVGEWAREPFLDQGGNPVLSPTGEAIRVMNYTKLFSVPMWASFGCLALLLLFYPSKSKPRPAA